MGTIQRFEDLEIWQLPRALCKKVYALTFQERLASDFRLKDQMRGSSGSALDNSYIAEKKFKELYDDANILTKKTTNFIAYLNTSKIKGQKFKNRVD